MKVFSDAAVSKDYVDAAATAAVATSSTVIDAVDAKQTLQIKQLRNIVALSFVLNLVITLTLKFLV
jgi:hypothetical protein